MVQILFILKKEPDANIKTIMTETARESEIIVVDLREDQDYDKLVEHIETCDRVITW
jgi:crotonobetainyl-CoA:carnitine CoA-transferase CaiB-like acyl-CoA transferase